MGGISDVLANYNTPGKLDLVGTVGMIVTSLPEYYPQGAAVISQPGIIALILRVGNIRITVKSCLLYTSIRKKQYHRQLQPSIPMTEKQIDPEAAITSVIMPIP